jgi:multiple sugar transport system ATP-binding protein
MEKTEGYICDTNISFVEPQGSHSILITRIGEVEIKIHTVKYMYMKPNTNVALNVKSEKVMFFDCDSTKRIKADNL